MKKISICIACYNEEKNIPLIYHALDEVLNQLPEYSFEILFADNASTDASVDILRAIARKDKRVKVIINNRNFGALRSGKNCLYHASGDAIISVTCDLQDPPEMIPEFIKKWEEGELVVWGQKTKSKENIIMYSVRTLYYKILKKFSTLPQYEHVTGFGLLDKQVLDEARKYSDNFMGMKAMVSELGYKICLLPYTQQKRNAGKSSYNLSRYIDLGISRLIQSSTRPLRLATMLGSIMSFCSFFIAIIYMIVKLCIWKSQPMGIAPILISIFFIGSIQLMFIGILGEYVGQILNRIIPAPLVIEKELINFDEDENSSEVSN